MWKQIIYNETETNYEISDIGEVRNKTTKKILKPRKKKTGYIEYNIYVNQKPVFILAHRLVANAFISNPQNLECVNHIDGNKENNSIDNLEWCTYNHNEQHCWNNNLNHAHILRSVKQYTLNGEYIQTFESVAAANRATGASKIRDVANGKRNSSGGYKWEWVEDFVPEDRGSKKAVAQLDDNYNIINIFESVSEAARQTGANRKGISSVCLGKQKKCFNYFWKFVDDDIVH